MAQSNLESIFSYSFTANNLLQISIVKQHIDKDYQRQYFCYITMVPGEKSDSSSTGRSYNFQNRITIKADAHKILALSEAVGNYAYDREQLIGPFTMFVDSSKSQYGSGGGIKSLNVQRSTDQQTNAPTVVIFMKSGQNKPYAFSMNISDALAFTQICKKIGNWCLDLEYNRDRIKVQPNQNYSNNFDQSSNQSSHNVQQNKPSNKGFYPISQEQTSNQSSHNVQQNKPSNQGFHPTSQEQSSVATGNFQNMLQTNEPDLEPF